ncbi:MAG: hypothetical protein ACRC6T_03980 [Sarcina sp.]
MKKSIYNIILDNTIDGIVDDNKAIEIIHSENSNLSVGFSHQFVGDQTTKKEHTDKVFAIIESLHKKEITTEELETELLEVGFETLNIIDVLAKKFNETNYNDEVYESFKTLMLTTDDVELCKLAIEMTAITSTCKELSNEYMLFGQVDHFSNSVSFIFRKWIQFDEFKEDMFKLLDVSADWTAIDYARSFMAIDSILEDIASQRHLLIGALSNNSIKMEIAVELATILDLNKLVSLSVTDRDLCIAINELFTSLLLELDRYGGIFAFVDSETLLKLYLNFLTNTRFEDIKFVGLDTFNEFITDLEDHYTYHVEGNYDEIIENVKAAVREFNTPENFDIALTYGDDNLYHLIRFAKSHDVSERAIKYFTQLDIKHELDKYLLTFLESLLAVKGNKEIKTQMFKELCGLYETRLKEKTEISKVNVFDDFEAEVILSRAPLIREFWNEGGFTLLKQLLEDYNPTIRVQTLEFIYTLDKNDLDNEIISKIRERLVDTPHYIVTEAVSVCEKFELI